MIRSISGILRDRLRESDVVARLGGDEFGILLHAAEEDEARAVAEELAGAVRQHAVAIGGQPTRVTASIGLAVLGRQDITAEQLLVEADVAMYAAKDGGRDQVVIYEPGTAAKAGMRVGIAWTERIRRALDEDQFALYCQPIYDLARGRISQYELLLRMVGEDGELVLPGAFLPTAERFGLIESIDEWTVKHAIGILERERRAGRDLELLIEINLSGRSVGNPDLPQLIESELERVSVDPGKLIFEITETAAIANMDEARKFANRMSALGCKFALDDFGAGFGSFYYLKYLPLDYLKIDGEFIRGLPRSPIDQRMVKAMVDIAGSLGMKTIAEFVEDEETLQLLPRFGVDFAQGYHVGRPQPADEVIGAQSAPN
jgi:EAL domain-containing protein (putative c-di-GMP-specific phosphodiesterase class I)